MHVRPSLRFALSLTLLLGGLCLPVDVKCCWCGTPCETQPLFVRELFPLPDSIHFECMKDADFNNLPYRSYRRSAR